MQKQVLDSSVFVLVVLFAGDCFAQFTSNYLSNNNNCDNSDANRLVTELSRENQQLRQNCNSASFSKDCPSDFTFIPGANKCYKLEVDQLEWEVARVRCRSLDKRAHLIIINDALEQTVAASFLANMSDTATTVCYAPTGLYGPWILVWTAGQRVNPARKSTFLWKPDNDNWIEMKYSAWIPGEPNFKLNQESCIHFGKYPDCFWNDVACGVTDGDIYAGEAIKYYMCPLCEIDMG